MCGLVGIITRNVNGFSHKDLDVFENLLFIDTLRGPDSTGVFLVTNDGNVHIVKGAVDGPEFLKTEEWKSLRNKAIYSGWALIGHNRKATRGSITDENAHPFWVDDKLVLVHNGTMYGDHKKHADVEVDSHAIAHVLADEQDVGAALRKINAAYALMWYNVEDKVLNVIRNKERPLSHVLVNTTWYITSETEILDFVIQRQFPGGKHEARYFPVGNLHKWKLEDDKKTTLAYEDVDHEYKYQPVIGGSVIEYLSDEHEYACAWSTRYRQIEEHGSISRTQPELEYYNGLETVEPWEQKISYSRLLTLRAGVFANNKVVRVELADILHYPGYNNGDSIFIGRLREAGIEGKYSVLFRVTKELADRTLQLDQDTAVFYVTLSNHFWRGDTVPNNDQGIMRLWATTPQLVIMSSVKQSLEQS